MTQPGAGFEHDTNAVTIITRDRDVAVPLQAKAAVADRILDRVVPLLGGARVSDVRDARSARISSSTASSASTASAAIRRGRVVPAAAGAAGGRAGAGGRPTICQPRCATTRRTPAPADPTPAAALAAIREDLGDCTAASCTR